MAEVLCIPGGPRPCTVKLKQLYPVFWHPSMQPRKTQACLSGSRPWLRETRNCTVYYTRVQAPKRRLLRISGSELRVADKHMLYTRWAFVSKLHRKMALGQRQEQNEMQDAPTACNLRSQHATVAQFKSPELGAETSSLARFFACTS